VFQSVQLIAKRSIFKKLKISPKFANFTWKIPKLIHFMRTPWKHSIWFAKWFIRMSQIPS
jgi:hypothetical protein